MSQTDEEKYIQDAGWRIYSKDGTRKFWQSPYDGRVYTTGHALIAEKIAEETRQAEARIARAEADQKSLETLDRFLNWEEGALEEIAPTPTKTRKKRRPKQSVEKNIKDLGYD